MEHIRWLVPASQLASQYSTLPPFFPFFFFLLARYSAFSSTKHPCLPIQATAQQHRELQNEEYVYS